MTGQRNQKIVFMPAFLFGIMTILFLFIDFPRWINAVRKIGGVDILGDEIVVTSYYAKSCVI